MKNVKKKVAVITSCVFLFVVGGSTGVYAYYKTPVSYVSLDINPSVELGINAFGKVVKSEGYNDDGKKVLEGLDLTNDNVKEAVKTVIDSVSDNGYIASDGSTVVSVTSETDNPELATEIQASAEDGVNEALDENDKDAVVEKDNVPLSLNKEARELGITPGKLNLIRKLQEVDPSATIEQYKDASVKTIMKDIQKNTEKGHKAATSTVEDEGTVDKATGTVNNENIELINKVGFEDKAESELMEIVLSLPDKYKDVIYLFYYEEYTVPKMAKLLKKNENTIYSHLHRARALIKQKLGGECNDYSF